MASLSELKEVRQSKKAKLIDFGMNPYPKSVPRTISIPELKKNFNKYAEDQSGVHSLAGRTMSVRGSGAIVFVTLLDEGEKFQIVLKLDVLGEKFLQLFTDTVDIGDFVSFTGTLFTTQRGENSLLANSWTMASKSILPLPEKWHGIEDEEEKNRKRYLDMVMDAEVYNRMKMRSTISTAIRNFFNNKGFLEIETPILQNQAGGANAKVFETYHNDYAMDMVLRIAVELDHKMVMAGGLPRIYEMGKMFRNEGSDPSHIQEFTMIEWYAAYATLEENISWTEELIKHLAIDVVGKNTFTVLGDDELDHVIDFSGTWPRRRFGDLLLEYAGIDAINVTKEELEQKANSLGASMEDLAKMGRSTILDYVYKRTARKQLISPTFVTHYPADLKPLAQQNDDGTAEVAQLIIAGMEITNQYAELVDPTVERALMEKQSQMRASGDEEAMEIDERFLTAMEHGMPPMTGFGMGIDRLVAILTEQKNLRDTIFFPIMRPKSE